MSRSDEEAPIEGRPAGSEPSDDLPLPEGEPAGPVATGAAEDPDAPSFTGYEPL